MADDTVVIRNARDVVALVNSGVGKGPSFWIILIAMGGVFTDAYDLISFGIGVPQVTREFQLTPSQVGALSASLSFGAIFGAWFGGYFIDKIGRLRMFMLDLVFFVVSAIGAGLSPDAYWLFAFRFFMGIGLGLDYPVALSFIAEYSAMKRKAVNVAAWITVSASCYVIFYLFIVLPLYLVGTGPNLWRWALGLGALPAAIVLVLRYIYMRESPMWAAIQGDLHEAARILEQSYGVSNVSVDTTAATPPRRSYTIKDYGRIFSGKYLRRTILVSIICPLQSMLFFAIVFYLPTISLLVFGKDFINAILGSAFFNAFGILGGIVAAYALPILGLRRLMIYALCGLIALLVILGLFTQSLPTFIAAGLLGLFIASYQGGVGQAGMTMATLSYPTSIRGAGTGWGQGILRVGSLLGAYLFPPMLAAFGLGNTLLLFAIVPLIMLVSVLVINWDPVGKEVDAEDFGPPALN
jgi:putative MFS transporter